MVLEQLQPAAGSARPYASCPERCKTGKTSSQRKKESRMKWLLLVVLVLAGILVLIVVIGALLPKKHTVSQTVSLRQLAETVWSLISGPPAWRPDISNYEELPAHDGHRMWRETDKHGQTITYEAIESAAPHRLVVRIADPKLPFGGTWTYDIISAGQSCSLTITEDGEVYNPLFRFVSRFIIGQTATLDAYIKALNAKLT
jgi:predicted nucleic acid-binding Zn ribbon protein